MTWANEARRLLSSFPPFNIEVERCLSRALREHDQRAERARRLAACCVCESGFMPAVDYMVHDHVWAAAGLTPKEGWAHISCLADKLGRPLGVDDLKDVPVNRELRWVLANMKGPSA